MSRALAVRPVSDLVSPTSEPVWLDRAAYPFQHRFQPLAAGRMHYVDEGEGEPLLFVHGTPTWSFEYRHLIAALRTRYRCIAPDHLGFGLSERPEYFSYTPEEHAKSLEEFVEKLGLKRFTLVVHDFGGPIGLPLALKHPERIQRLVVLNTWMWSLADDRHFRLGAKLFGGWFGRFAYRYLNVSLKVIAPSAYGDRTKLTPAIHRQYLSVFPTPKSRGQVLWPLARALLTSSSHYESLWNGRERLQHIPAQIIWGLKDSAFPPRLLARWKEALPHARVDEIANAGHWPHEEEPEKVLEVLRSFLSA